MGSSEPHNHKECCIFIIQWATELLIHFAYDMLKWATKLLSHIWYCEPQNYLVVSGIVSHTPSEPYMAVVLCKWVTNLLSHALLLHSALSHKTYFSHKRLFYSEMNHEPTQLLSAVQWATGLHMSVVHFGESRTYWIKNGYCIRQWVMNLLSYIAIPQYSETQTDWFIHVYCTI